MDPRLSEPQTLDWVFSCPLNRTVVLSGLFTYPGWRFQEFVRRGPENGGSTVHVSFLEGPYVLHRIGSTVA